MNSTLQAVRSERRPETMFADAYAVLQNAIDAQAFPGCAFGVLAGGEVVLEGALGNFTYDADSEPVRISTRYDIASVSKVVGTTAIAMLLYQNGKLDLDMPLGEVLPGFIVGRDPEQHGCRVTLRHLLAHSSGLPGYRAFFRTAPTATELMRECLSLPIEAEPGTRAEYSDPGFILLGKALETLTGESLDTLVRREVLARLDMMHTGYSPAAQIRALIPPTERDEKFRLRVIQGEVQDENAYLLGEIAGHAGLFSNVADLLAFSRAVLDPEKIGLFKSQIVDVFAERQAPDDSSRALGWDTPSSESSSGSHFSSNSVGHLGYSGCSMWLDRDAKIAVVLLTNRTWPNREGHLIRTVRPAFHDAVRQVLA